MNTAKALKPQPELLSIPVEQLHDSPLNSRKAFVQAELEELAASLKQHGLLQPVVVRDRTKGGGYELVFGHRRARAARLAGLAEVPAILRQMTDLEILEAQLCENLKRVDLHPLEEADGYRELHEKHGLKVDDIAAKLGKSREYIYARLKLGAIQGAGRKAFEEGKINASVALLIARIPILALQEKAAEEILAGDLYNPSGEPMSYREAADHVQERYTLRLGEAPFSRTDVLLVPAAGACSSCPKKTGNCRELYPDIKSADVCTDPECFGQKKKAAFAQQKDEAAAKGRKLLAEKEAKALFNNWDSQLSFKGKEKYVGLSEKCEEDPKKRTYGQLLGKEAPIVVARDPKGKTHELVARQELPAALEKAGHKIKPKAQRATGPSPAWKKQQEEHEKKVASTSRVMALLEPKIIDRLKATKKFDLSFFRVLAHASLGENWNIHDTPKRFGVNGGEALRKKIDTLKLPELVELIVAVGFEQSRNAIIRDESSLLEAGAAALKLDLKATRKKAAAAEAGICFVCGCSEERACDGGCSWADKAETLCSACVGDGDA